MHWPKSVTHYLLYLIVLLTLIARNPVVLGHGYGLVTAQKGFAFFKQGSQDLGKSASENSHKNQRVLENLRALRSSDSSSKRSSFDQDPDIDGKGEKKRRLSKGKDTGNLLEVVSNAKSTQPDGTGKKRTKSKNKIPKSRHEDDIVHHFDHADNEAYDDIVWYDGPHRDDEEEEEHGYSDEHHEDEHDDHHHDHNDDDESEQDYTMIKGTNHIQYPKEEKHDIQGSPFEQQNPSRQHSHSNYDKSGFTATFQHAGAEIMSGPTLVKKFCLRLKHECEPTCREFRSGIEHLSITCGAGSVAELLFWGKCCQLGQVNRTQQA
ncbi:hypothetical protein BGZ49_007706 [Haplosporangium sp. Z 27]|nr:hypothetical protein BGZ49_007706 [Haplosporangium sp. Z 27]